MESDQAGLAREVYETAFAETMKPCCRCVLEQRCLREEEVVYEEASRFERLEYWIQEAEKPLRRRRIIMMVE